MDKEGCHKQATHSPCSVKQLQEQDSVMSDPEQGEWEICCFGVGTQLGWVQTRTTKRFGACVNALPSSGGRFQLRTVVRETCQVRFQTSDNQSYSVMRWVWCCTHLTSSYNPSPDGTGQQQGTGHQVPVSGVEGTQDATGREK